MRSHISFVNRPPGREHIPVAGACLLESPNQEALLLTKRPWHMRTYPGLWVPPGGHSEPGELIQVKLRSSSCSGNRLSEKGSVVSIPDIKFRISLVPTTSVCIS